MKFCFLMKRRYLRLSTRAELHMKHAALSSRHTQLPNLVVYLGFKISYLSLRHISVMLPCIAACCFNPSIILASTCSLWGDTGSSLISICMIFAGSDRVIAWIPDTLNSACINHKVSCPAELLLNQLMDSSPGNWIQIYLLFWKWFILTI